VKHLTQAIGIRRSVKADPSLFSLGAAQERVALPVDGVGSGDDCAGLSACNDGAEELEDPWCALQLASNTTAANTNQ
jgi:hypothetical protein